MKTWITLTLIGLYFVLGILAVAIFNKYEHESIEQSDPICCVFFIMIWPLILSGYLGCWLVVLPLRLCTILTNLITKKEDSE